MSEEFTPQGPSSSEPGRAFSIHPGPVAESLIFQMQWPELKPREYAALEEKRRGEVEKRLLQEAEEKARMVEKAAYDKGFAQGEKDGREAARKAGEAACRKLQNLIAALQAQKEEAYERLERELVQLAFILCRKIVRGPNPFPEAAIRETLRAAFQEVKDRKEVRVRLHPGDTEDLRSGGDPSAGPGWEALGGATIVADPAVTRGGCILETSYGEVDATVETQFDILVGLFWEKVKNSGFPAGPHE